MKRLLPYTHASAMRLWWNLVSLWYCRKANKAQDAFEKGSSDLTLFYVLAEQAGKRADEWDAEVQRMKEKK